ncbi:MAG: Hint domain-containing protein [Elusimicrobiota bacterium]
MKTTKYFFAAALALAGAMPAGGEFISSGGFPAGTMIAATSGDIPIEEVKQGDRILAFSEDTIVQSEVRDTYRKRSLLFTLGTTQGKLICTRYNMLLSYTGFVEIQKVNPGDGVAVMKNGRRIWAKVKSVKFGNTAVVYNIETGPPHTFIANGFLVHN